MTAFQLRIALVALSLSWAIGNRPAHAGIIYVDDSAINGKNDGSSWDNAFLHLHDGLAAAHAQDEIHIGQGLYKPAGPGGDRTAAFHLVNGVIVQGGYAGVGSTDPEALDPQTYATILSGDLNGDDGPAGSWTNYGENSLHVVVANRIDESAQLRGVTVRAGCANIDTPEGHVGGGIFALGSTLVITDCSIEDSQAWLAEGGIASGGPLLATNCIIRRNRHIFPIGGTGGVSAGAGSSFVSCLFQENHAPYAGSSAALSTSHSSIDSCVFSNNYAAEDAGAIYGSYLTITNCEFTSNGCGVYGGAIRGQQNTISHCQFTSNSGGSFGGAISGNDLSISDCVFSANKSSIGGSISTTGNSGIVNCVFDGNMTYINNGYNAGAIYNTGTLKLVNCIFRKNFAQLYGGALDNHGMLNAINCVFAGNTTKSTGGALQNFAVATLTNCTIVGNIALLGQSSSNSGAIHNQSSGRIQIQNCILWDNSANGQTGQSNQIHNDNGAVMVTDSCVMGWDGSLGGYGNFGDNPMMIDADGPDNVYGTMDDNPRLSARSPCRDAGNNAFLPSDEFDLDGDGDTVEPIPLDLDLLPRIVNSIVDTGAFEFQGQGCPADVAPANAGDAQINVDDLLAIINAWGPCSSACSADINNDGTVNVDDLLAVIIAWGACP